MAQDAFVEAGKRWIEQVFERLSQELLVASWVWVWVANDPDYCFCFQLVGQDEREALTFTRGTLTTCGNPSRGHAAVRRRVEAAMRTRLLALLSPPHASQDEPS